MPRKKLPVAQKKGRHMQVWFDDDQYAALQRAIMLEPERPMMSPWCRGIIMQRVRQRLQSAGVKQYASG